MNRPPPEKLLAIEWSTVKLATDADALALWTRIAPTGDDWERKLAEVPDDIAHHLAIAMLRAGNFACAPAPATAADCAQAAPADMPEPSATATLADPCLRRMLALWSFDQTDASDATALHDALKAIVALPPPESQLVATALHEVPETDQDFYLELLAIAMKAHQRDLANTSVGHLDVAHLTDAVLKLHVDGALDVLSAEAHRPVFMKAVADEQLAAATRKQAIVELTATDDKLAPDLKAVLIAATKSPSCEVAAAAARALEGHGDASAVPRRPRTTKPEAIMRALCVLASYESAQRPEETSLLPSYLPARGLDLVRVTYDPYNDVDTDGDGDPHTEHTAELVPRDGALLPELDDLVRAMQHCTGTTCRSDDHEFRFQFRVERPGSAVLDLMRLDVIDRPPCKH